MCVACVDSAQTSPDTNPEVSAGVTSSVGSNAGSYSNDFLNGIIWGGGWTGDSSGTDIYYAVGDGSYGGLGWTATEELAIHTAVSTFSAVCDVTFTEVASGHANADIIFATVPNENIVFGNAIRAKTRARPAQVLGP